jgi:FixJ family two-component response regulator
MKRTELPSSQDLADQAELRRHDFLVSIVDDDPDVRESLSCLLRSLAYNTATFSSADDFLRSGNVPNTSCLISDVRMPGMSGPQLQDRLAAERHRIPIIFITAIPDKQIERRVLDAGAVGFLCKPCAPQHLIDLLEKATRGGPNASAA